MCHWDFFLQTKCFPSAWRNTTTFPSVEKYFCVSVCQENPLKNLKTHRINYFRQYKRINDLRTSDATKQYVIEGRRSKSKWDEGSSLVNTDFGGRQTMHNTKRFVDKYLISHAITVVFNYTEEGFHWKSRDNRYFVVRSCFAFRTCVAPQANRTRRPVSPLFFLSFFFLYLFIYLFICRAPAA